MILVLLFVRVGHYNQGKRLFSLRFFFFFLVSDCLFLCTELGVDVCFDVPATVHWECGAPSSLVAFFYEGEKPYNPHEPDDNILLLWNVD